MQKPLKLLKLPLILRLNFPSNNYQWAKWPPIGPGNQVNCLMNFPRKIDVKVQKRRWFHKYHRHTPSCVQTLTIFPDACLFSAPSSRRKLRKSRRRGLLIVYWTKKKEWFLTKQATCLTCKSLLDFLFIFFSAVAERSLCLTNASYWLPAIAKDFMVRGISSTKYRRHKSTE